MINEMEWMDLSHTRSFDRRVTWFLTDRHHSHSSSFTFDSFVSSYCFNVNSIVFFCCCNSESLVCWLRALPKLNLHITESVNIFSNNYLRVYWISFGIRLIQGEIWMDFMHSNWFQILLVYLIECAIAGSFNCVETIATKWQLMIDECTKYDF